MSYDLIDLMDLKNFNISVFSYNVFWKVMVESNSPLVSHIGIKKLKKLKMSILENILSVKNYYSPFIYCFQEAESHNDILKLFEKNIFDYNVGYSNPEHILTIWNINVIKKLFVANDEFEPGRPFSLFVFEDLRFCANFILVNVHAGHKADTFVSIFQPIQHLINLHIDAITRLEPTRIIICGDFNRDIQGQISIEPKRYFLKIKNKKFFFGNNTDAGHEHEYEYKSVNKTCCNLNGYAYNKNYDQVIDSYDSPIIVYPLNKEKWYIPQSSDHIAVISIVKNYNQK